MVSHKISDAHNVFECYWHIFAGKMNKVTFLLEEIVQFCREFYIKLCLPEIRKKSTKRHQIWLTICKFTHLVVHCCTKWASKQATISARFNNYQMYDHICQLDEIMPITIVLQELKGIFCSLLQAIVDSTRPKVRNVYLCSCKLE